MVWKKKKEKRKYTTLSQETGCHKLKDTLLYFGWNLRSEDWGVEGAFSSWTVVSVMMRGVRVMDHMH